MFLAHEEFRHSIIRCRLAGSPESRGPCHERKAHGIGPFENQQRVQNGRLENQFAKISSLRRIVRADEGEQARIQIDQGVYVFAVDTFNPLAIFSSSGGSREYLTSKEFASPILRKKTQPGPNVP